MRLSEARRRLGWGQHDLAAASDIKVGTLRNWEQGLREPGFDDIEKLAKALEVSPADFFGERSILPTPQEALEVLAGVVHAAPAISPTERQILDRLASLNQAQRDILFRALGLPSGLDEIASEFNKKAK